MPNTPAASADVLPSWIMPLNLATIVAEDGEWEDASWDPLLLTIMGDTRFEGRDIALAWQLSLWADDAPATLRTAAAAASGKADGHGLADWLIAGVSARVPGLADRLHDESDGATCILWVETEADGRALVETAWLCLSAAEQQS